MGSKTFDIPWGKGKMSLNLPENWRILGEMSPVPVPAVPDAAKETRRALQEPIGSPPLASIARPGMKVALVIDDLSRPTPVPLLLPAVLEELSKSGVDPSQVTVIPALGLHRPMESSEIIQRTGVPGLKFENPDCDDFTRLVNLGTTSRGSPVWVNKTVAAADLVISIGCIEPHTIASFGGGFKNLFPGTAGRAMIANNHSLNCAPATFNMVGQPIEQNPMRLDLEEAGRMIKAPVFIVNAVVNSSLQVVRVVCGDGVEAHRAGVKVSAEIYGAAIPARADVVIASSHPMDSDLRQGVKALANTIRAVKPGGVHFTLVKAEEGTGVFGLASRKLPLGRKALKLLAPLLLALIPKLKLSGVSDEDKFFLYFAIKAMTLCTMLMYAPTIPPEVKANLPFVTFVDDPGQAIRLAEERFPTGADVLVFPSGGSTFPILPQ